MKGRVPRLWCTLCRQHHAANHSFGPSRNTRHINPREYNAMWQYIDYGARSRDEYVAAATSRALTRERRAHG